MTQFSQYMCPVCREWLDDYASWRLHVVMRHEHTTDNAAAPLSRIASNGTAQEQVAPTAAAPSSPSQAPCESPPPDRDTAHPTENPATVLVSRRHDSSKDGMETEAKPAAGGDTKCFWKTGCSNNRRCREFGQCVAEWQNAHKAEIAKEAHPDNTPTPWVDAEALRFGRIMVEYPPTTKLSAFGPKVTELIPADFARSLERLVHQQQGFINLYLAKADAMYKQACEAGVSQMLHTNGDAQQARTISVAYAALKKEIERGK